MTPAGVALILSPEERELVEALREVPESPLRRKMCALLRELFAFAEDPHCGEVQGDGVSCDDPASQCDRCARVTRVMDSLSRRLAE